MRRHVLPRLAGTVIVQLSLFGAAAVLLESRTRFLGVGVQRATWGSLISEASQNLGTQPWLLVPSGFLVITFVLALGWWATPCVTRWPSATTMPRPDRGGAERRRRLSAEPAAPPPDRDALLSVRGLTVAFPVDGAEVPVVTDVDLDVMAGEAVGIVGRVGCGKSVTALSILGCTARRRPDSSRAASSSRAPKPVGAPERLNQVRGARIGWISQDPIASLDPASARIADRRGGAPPHGCSRRAAMRRAVELLALVRLPNPRRWQAVPASALRRHGPAVGIAGRERRRPGHADRRRADDGARCHRPGEILDLLRELQAGAWRSSW